MDAIKIESTISAKEINHIIEEIPIKKDIIISFEEYKDRYRYIFSLNKTQVNQDKLFLKAIAKFVNKIIFRFHVEDTIAFNIEKKIGLIDSIDKFKIIGDVKEVLASKSLYIKEKEDMEDEISNYFLEYDILIIDGYLKFRSKAFSDLIDKAIELVLGNFQLEVEYSEFIDMLKALVDSQVPELDLINIALKDNKYILMDSNKNIINDNHMSMVIEDLYYEYEEVSEADILLSTIIALSPKKIIMHLGDKNEDDLTSILEEIFEDRFIVCRDCELCNK